MKIAEVFYSIQGEGTLLGVPSVFLRTSGCNLRCVWCDTPYTSWKPEGRDWSIHELLQYVEGCAAGHVVVTGGEPMIQPEIAALTEGLRAMGRHITIETAGTVFRELACDLMSISPKLENSRPPGEFATQHERLRYQPDVLRRLINHYSYQLKFVVAAPEDMVELSRVVEEVGAETTRVLLMPEGTTAAAVRERGLWLAEECKRTGFRYSPRLHVDLWGDRRGV
ncbi:MAG: 7-carboxy-7-deazaguanine synthase QueE [Acidobacteria bacterium]|nr:7-carboxy-7-deazaguanine synthase QueE [Acidobacteriota bacterium]